MIHFCFFSTLLRRKSRAQTQVNHNSHTSATTPSSSSLIAQIIVLLTTLCLLSTPGASSASTHPKEPHTCFVCLPQDKSSRLAIEIMDSFPGKDIPDCASFPDTPEEQNNAHQFQFSCPRDFSGCLIRTSGTEISRFCTHFKDNDCKLVNGIELCYCAHSLCNSDKVSMKTRAVSETTTVRAPRHFHEGETDDEDLLITGLQHGHSLHDDELGSEGGSGHEHYVPDDSDSEETERSEEESLETETEGSDNDIDTRNISFPIQFENSSSTTSRTHIPEVSGGDAKSNAQSLFVPVLSLCFLVILRNY